MFALTLDKIVMKDSVACSSHSLNLIDNLKLIWFGLKIVKWRALQDQIMLVIISNRII